MRKTWAMLVGMVETGSALGLGGDPHPVRLAIGGAAVAWAGERRDGQEDNPALLVGEGCWGAGVAGTRLFGMEDLPVLAAWAGKNVGSWSTGMGVRQLVVGEAYRETLLRLGVGRRLGAWSLGVSLAGWQAKWERGGSWAGGHLDVGALWEPMPWLGVGACSRRLGGWENAGERWPRDWTFGWRAATVDGLWTGMGSLRWEPGFRPSWHVGQEMAPASWARLRLGLGLEPFLVGAGVGLQGGGMHLDASVSGEPRLGFQTAVAVGVTR